MKKKEKELTARQKRIAALEAKLEDGLNALEVEEYEKLVKLELAAEDSDTRNRDTNKTGRTKRIVGWVSAITGGIGSIGSILLFNSYVDKGFEFEKEGTYTSSTFKEIIHKIPNLLKFGGSK